MRTLYVMAYAGICIVLLGYIHKCIVNGEKIALKLRNVLLSATISIVVSICILASNTKHEEFLTHGVYLISTDWLVFFFVQFTIAYTDVQRIGKKCWTFLTAVVLADTIYLLTYCYIQIFYEVQLLPLQASLSWVHLKLSPAYVIHGCIVYSLLLFSVVLLVYRSIQTSSFYRRKYLVVAVVLVIVFLVNVHFSNSEKGIDASAIGYAIAGILMYYFSLSYVPKALEAHILSMVAEGIDDGIIVFDNQGKCVYRNSILSHMKEVPQKKGEIVGDSKKRWYGYANLETQKDMVVTTQLLIDDELSTCNVSVNHMKDKKGNYLGIFLIIHDRTEALKKMEQEYYRATHDKLTGLYTKEYFYERCSTCLQMHPNEKYVLVVSDLKKFKLVNDLFGVQVGDDILKRFALKLKEQTIPGEIFGRLDNDQFGLLMPKERFKEEDVMKHAEDITFVSEDTSYPLSVAIGVYEIVDDSLSVQMMLDRAMMALSTVKGEFQTCVAYYDESMREKVLNEQSVVRELDKAIEHREIQIYLQSQLDTERKVCGAEALVRWVDPVKGVLLPYQFIPIFEKNGMISKMDQYVWQLACEQLAKWKQMGRTDLHISVNISPKDFYFLDIYSIFVGLVRRYDISPQLLKLEITETAMMADLTGVLELIEKLKTFGFSVEMDDFGSGYSSLNTLKDLCVDVVKIDRGFLQKSVSEERSRVILEMVISLSKKLGMVVLTEGVETEEQFEWLQSMGCDMYQGYYFSKPISVEEFEEKYQIA